MFIDLTADEWEDFFPDTCLILILTPSKNSILEQKDVWVPFIGHTAVSCSIVHKTGKVLTATGEQIGVSSHEIGLRGYFPAVEAETKPLSATIGGISYRVLSAGSDSQHVKTTLLVERTK